MSVNAPLGRYIDRGACLGQGVVLNAPSGSTASAIGPSVAVAILSVAHWPWLFAVNVPLGILGNIIAWHHLPDTPRTRGKFDVISALLQAAAFGLLLIGISEMGHGDAPIFVGLEIASGLGIGAFLVVRQLSRTAPLLPVDLLRIPLFALSVASSVCSFISQGMAGVALPFLFQPTRGTNPVQAGLLMTPRPLGAAGRGPLPPLGRRPRGQGG